MIFEALQSELFRFKFHSLSSKILKIPEFSLCIWSDTELVFDMWPLIKIKYRSKSSVSLINIPSIQYLKYISSRRKRQKEVEPFCSPLWFLKMDRKGWNIGTWNSFYNSFRKWLWWISGEKTFQNTTQQIQRLYLLSQQIDFATNIWLASTKLSSFGPEPFRMSRFRISQKWIFFKEFTQKLEIIPFAWKWFRMQEKKVNWLNSKWVEPLAFKYW